MSELKHTPWVANPDGEVVSEEYVVDGVTYVDHICNCEVINGESPEARLIAAAPDLLAALQEFVDLFPDVIDGDAIMSVLDKGMTAISKATGE